MRIINFLINKHMVMFIHADIDECGDGTNSCNVNAECTNTGGSYTCSCSSGYTGDGMRCIGEYYVSYLCTCSECEYNYSFPFRHR